MSNPFCKLFQDSDITYFSQSGRVAGHPSSKRQRRPWQFRRRHRSKWRQLRKRSPLSQRTAGNLKVRYLNRSNVEGQAHELWLILCRSIRSIYERGRTHGVDRAKRRFSMLRVKDIGSAKEKIIKQRNQTKCTRSTSFAYHNSDTILLPTCLFERLRLILENYNTILRDGYSRGLPLIS